MAAETKTVTMRLPMEVADFLTREDTSITQAVVDDIQALKSIRAVSAREIRGLFTTQEWTFLADSLNGTMMIDSMRYASFYLMAHNEDAELYDGTATRHGVKVKDINEKISRLSGAQIDAIYCRIEHFWKYCSSESLDQWAKF